MLRHCESDIYSQRIVVCNLGAKVVKIIESTKGFERFEEFDVLGSGMIKPKKLLQKLISNIKKFTKFANQKN